MNNIIKKQRLSKYLAGAGVASRRACEALIFGKRVRVNGQLVEVPQTLVDNQDHIEVDGKPVQTAEEKHYYVLNKPIGYICTAKRTADKTKLVLDLFEDVPVRLFTAGRLDKYTAGLLIVTNDGVFANSVIHPSSNIHKEYLVKTDAEITPEHLQAISTGTLVEGVFVKPVKVVKVRRGTLKITVSEGKKHEVRHLIENAALNLIELTRIRIGNLHLGSLAPGQYRPMTEQEMDSFYQAF